MKNKLITLRTSVLFIVLASGFVACATQNGNSTISEQSSGQKGNGTHQVNQPTSATDNPPTFIKNGQPGEMHKRLDALVGEWSVEKSRLMYRLSAGVS